jgi:hypothetical protein
MARCAYDGQRYGPGDTELRGQFLIHLDRASEPIKPVHEVVEGRLIDESGAAKKHELPRLKRRWRLPPLRRVRR